MNGISSNLKEEIKKSKESKHKEKFKLVTTILVTNIFVALMCLPDKQEISPPKKTEKILHKDYEIVILPVTALIDKSLLNAPETLVTLVNKDKKVIAAKAYLHEEAENSQFKIEIPKDHLVKVADLLEEGVLAIPYVEMRKTTAVKKRGSKYEVNF